MSRILNVPYPTASGWWLAGGISAGDCLAAYQAKGAASLAASYSNLNNPGTNDATLGVAPSWAAGTGWTFNGTSQYLKTGIIPNGANYSCIVRISGSTATLQGLVSCSNTADTQLFGFSSLSNMYYLNGNYASSGTYGSGTYAVAGSKGYKNGVDVGITLSNLGCPYEIYIGARNEEGTANRFMSDSIIGLAVYSKALSASEVAAVTTAMAAL